MATGLPGKDLGNKHPDFNPLLPFCLLTNFPSTKTKLEGERKCIRKRDWTPRAQKTTGMGEYSFWGSNRSYPHRQRFMCLPGAYGGQEGIRTTGSWGAAVGVLGTECRSYERAALKCWTMAPAPCNTFLAHQSVYRGWKQMRAAPVLCALCPWVLKRLMNIGCAWQELAGKSHSFLIPSSHIHIHDDSDKSFWALCKKKIWIICGKNGAIKAAWWEQCHDHGFLWKQVFGGTVEWRLHDEAKMGSWETI